MTQENLEQIVVLTGRVLKKISRTTEDIIIHCIFDSARGDQYTPENIVQSEAEEWLAKERDLKIPIDNSKKTKKIDKRYRIKAEIAPGSKYPIFDARKITFINYTDREITMERA